jgi:hypothetical protein
VKALLAEGNESQAHDWLWRVYAGIVAYGLAWLRPEADALAERLCSALILQLQFICLLCSGKVEASIPHWYPKCVLARKPS